MATTTERINNLAASSSMLSGATKEEQEAGRASLHEKHAQQAKRKGQRTFAGVMVDAEAEAAREADALSKKRQRENEVNDLAAEQQKADEEAAERAKKALALQLQASAKKDTKPKMMAGLLVVKKPKTGDCESGAEKNNSCIEDASTRGAVQTDDPKAAVTEVPAAAAGGIGLGSYGSSSDESEAEEDEKD
eukprot:TRINITY_DN42359_c0_g1_i1.p2 TRINITY_DN42359_c0_g1~~TRINITY_DN42359_c0_g1_i1.p2  ORF type:complete len:209 (-),score=74.69 TRINITY_DN42359_c0_g1_i1:130-702(-)